MLRESEGDVPAVVPGRPDPGLCPGNRIVTMQSGYINTSLSMLIKFYSKVGAFTMFGDIGVKLLKAMGQSGALPGAIRPKDIPAAVARLKGVVSESGGQPAGAEDGDDGEAVPVTLRQRAFPLIELLERAAAEDCEVLWKEG